jgi:hypothetical protein
MMRVAISSLLAESDGLLLMGEDLTWKDVLKVVEEKRRVDQAEIDKTFAQFGKCLTTWANVEYALLFVFQEALGRPNLALISAVFYSIENFRSKIGAVDSVLSIILKDNVLLEQWSGKGGLLNRLQAKVKIRNNMAHCGAMYQHENDKRKVHISRFIYFDRDKSGGYTFNNLIFIENEFRLLLRDLSSFAMLLEKPTKHWLKSAPRGQHLQRIRRLYDQSRTKQKEPP